MNLFKYCLLFKVLFLSSLVRAQDCNLQLRILVSDEDNAELLEFAVIKHINSGMIVQTDEHGELLLKSLCPGEHKFLVQHVGCSDSIFTIYLQGNRKVTFRLPHNLNALQDVEVVTHHDRPKSTQSTQTLDELALQKRSGLPLAEQLTELKGVTTLKTGPTVSKPMLNGMQGYRVLLLNHGVRLEGQQWGTEHAPEIDPFTAGRISVVRGAAAVMYGSDAIGGVISVEPKEMPDTASITGNLQLAGQSNGRGGGGSMMLQGYADRVKYLSWRLQGSLRKSGDVRTPGYFLRNTAVEEYNYSAALGYHQKRIGLDLYHSQFNTRFGIFSGAHIGNLTDLLAAFSLNKPADSLAAFSYRIESPFQNVSHDLTRLHIDIHTGNRSRINVNLARQFNLRQEFDVHGDAHEEEEPSADYRLSTFTGELSWEHDPIRSFAGKCGIQGMHQINTYQHRFFIPNYRSNSLGVFAIERYVQPRYELEAGVRYDVRQLESFFYERGVMQQPVRSFDHFSYNAGVILKFSTRLRALLNLGSGWRSPAVNELYSDGLHHGVAAIEKGQKDLKKETSLNLSTSLVYSEKKLRAEITAYNYWFSDYIYYVPGGTQLSIQGAFPVFRYLQTDALLYGADAEASYAVLKNLELRAKLMGVRGKTTGGDWLPFLPADRGQLGLTVRRDPGRKFAVYFSPSVVLVTRQSRVRPELDFVSPPPGYVLFNVGAGLELRTTRQPWHIHLEVSNAGNSRYRDYLDRFRYYTDAQGINFQLRIKIPIVVYDKK